MNGFQFILRLEKLASAAKSDSSFTVTLKRCKCIEDRNSLVITVSQSARIKACSKHNLLTIVTKILWFSYVVQKQFE